MNANPIINIDDVPLLERGNGKSFAVKPGRVGPQLGLEAQDCAVHVGAPDKKAFPFHRHHVMDELFYIVSGDGEYLWGDETLPVKTVDLIAAPVGIKPHQFTNTDRKDPRYHGISSMGGVDIVEYPESGKVGAAAGIKNGDFKSATYVAIGSVAPADYCDGEEKGS